MRVLADPWDASYGMGFSLDEDLADVAIDIDVEGLNWSRPVVPMSATTRRVAFIDGVRRIEMRLLLADEATGKRVAGALGSFAVGCAFAGVDAGFGDGLVGRRFITGGGLPASESMTARVGGVEIRWEPTSVPGEDDLAVQMAVHNEMRGSEADLGQALASTGLDLILVDGPLGFFDATDSPVVGIVKRSVRRYLEGGAAWLLPRLGPGSRTPLFTIGDAGSGSYRFSWYARIAPLREVWHDHAGLVRCEISGGLGIDAASELADEVTALLPRYAGNAADPRTPQNLGPVASLERRLRHSLGDELILRRAALAELTRRERSAS